MWGLHQQEENGLETRTKETLSLVLVFGLLRDTGNKNDIKESHDCLLS